uniref:Uncharacterized protein n=1 Tax=Picea glauca TaxID=3330 RepID=A0A101LZJ9_PICGL|nr:hypothetical protein ABT39_MTgene5216 [Picea glauca]QHR91190.1 hypothetical protein Q903MT_gene5222 [Picea sitchensis]
MGGTPSQFVDIQQLYLNILNTYAISPIPKGYFLPILSLYANTGSSLSFASEKKNVDGIGSFDLPCSVLIINHFL